MLSTKANFVVSQSTEQLLDYYNRVRQESVSICQPLEKEDYTIQTMPDVSPPKWHLAHTSWFFETFLLKPYFPNYPVFHPKYEYLFNSYYEQVACLFPRAKRGLLSRPTVQEIIQYRYHVDGYMTKLLGTPTFNNKQSIIDKVILGLNHEQQHQELLYTDILHIFANNPLQPQYRVLDKIPNSATPLDINWIAFSESLTQTGFSDYGFHFDNEKPVHEFYIAKFKIASRLVTNGEYLEFINEGGYSQSKYWLSDGWKIINNEKWQQPLYWQQGQDSSWSEMTLAGLIELDENAPVSHISYFEADAYANWCEKRLPTEYEWERAAQTVSKSGNLRDSDNCRPIAARPNNELQQMYGDVWEWTRSPYGAYPGFKVDKGAIGEYNGKFMSSQMVLKGGSCVTPKEHIRSSYRNFFYPENRWQFSGIRLAQDI